MDDLRLRHQTHCLPAHRNNGLVIEQRLGTVTGSVDKGAFWQCQQLVWMVECPDINLSTSGQEISHQLTRIGRDVEHQAGPAPRVSGWERVTARKQIYLRRQEVVCKPSILRLVFIFCLWRRAVEVFNREWCIGEFITIEPFD
ncbi:hypothetical protein D3C77_566610 [compost metagenome]